MSCLTIFGIRSALAGTDNIVYSLVVAPYTIKEKIEHLYTRKISDSFAVYATDYIETTDTFIKIWHMLAANCSKHTRRGKAQTGLLPASTQTDPWYSRSDPCGRSGMKESMDDRNIKTAEPLF